MTSSSYKRSLNVHLHETNGKINVVARDQNDYRRRHECVNSRGYLRMYGNDLDCFLYAFIIIALS